MAFWIVLIGTANIADGVLAIAKSRSLAAIVVRSWVLRLSRQEIRTVNGVSVYFAIAGTGHFRTSFRKIETTRCISSGRMLKASNPFDQCSQDYSRFRPDYPAALLDHIGSLWPPSGKPVVIDVGAGTGKASAPLVDRDASVISIEPSLAMIAEGRRCYPKLKYVCAASEELPIASNAADMVTAAQSFHWFEVPRALAEFAR